MSEPRSRWLQYLDALVGISVVLSLIVLIVEVRGNSLMIERQIRTERAERIVAPLLDQNELLSAYEKIKAKDGWESDIRALMDEYGLEPAEAVAWSRMLLGVWWGLEIEFLTTGGTEELADSIRGLVEYPDARIFWITNREGFDPAFRAWANLRLDLASRAASSEPTP